MKSFLRICFVFTVLPLSLLMFSTGIASANMTHKQVKGAIYKTGCPMMKKTGCPMMKKTGCPMMKKTGCPMMKMMGMMNGEKRDMEMNKKM